MSKPSPMRDHAVRPALAALAVSLAIAPGAREASLRADEPEAADRVVLVVEFGDGKRKEFRDVAWSEEMTVLDALKAVEKRRPGIKIEYRGRGGTAFLTKIDDVENEGGGAERKNWLYWINGKRATRGIGAGQLNKGDKILWKFTQFKPDAK